MGKNKAKNFRKIAAATTICLAIATPMILTGCSSEEVDVGTKWFTGVEIPTNESGKVGDFYLDTDDLDIYQKSSEGWKLVGSLKGETGAIGPVGATGVGIASIQKSSTTNNIDTYTITYTDATTSEFYVTNGTTPNIYIGSNGNWFVGTTDLGVKAQGETGKSAYEIAVDNGFEGTQQEWLESLKGATGAQGPQGEPGQKGEKGDTGAQGTAGEKGETGVSITKVESEYGFTSNGQECIYFTIYYSNDTSETIIAVIPKKAISIEIMGNAFTALEEGEIDTGLTLRVEYEDGSTDDDIALKTDMISGIDDFSVPGTYDAEIFFNGAKAEAKIVINPELSKLKLLDVFEFSDNMKTQFGIHSGEITIYEEGYCNVVIDVPEYNYHEESISTWSYLSEELSNTNKTAIIKTTFGDSDYAFVANSETDILDFYSLGGTALKTYQGQYNNQDGKSFVDAKIEIHDAGLLQNKKVYVVKIDDVICLSGEYNDDSILNLKGETYKLNETNLTFEHVSVVANVNGEEFYSLNDAVRAAAVNGCEVSIVNDMTVNETINITEGNIRFNLNGYTLTSELATAFKITNGRLYVYNGEINVQNEAFRVDGTGENATALLQLNNNVDVVSQNDCCIFIKGIGAKLETAANLTSHGVYATIQGNGNLTSAVSEIVINGGNIIQTNSEVAIYVPQTGNFTVNDGTIQGGTALYIKSGNINIQGGNFIATGEKHAYQYNGDGCSMTGDAIVIDACGYPGGNPTVWIAQCSVQSENGHAVAYYKYNNNEASVSVHPNSGIEIYEEEISAQ